MKWDAIERSPGVRDFSAGDAIVAYAESQGARVKGHALIWHGSVPGWVNGLSAADLRTAVEDHIRAVAGHYRGRVLAWDVVNEAIDDDGSGLRDTVFRRSSATSTSPMPSASPGRPIRRRCSSTTTTAARG